MKNLLLLILFILSTHILLSQVRVSGHFRKNGTYVEPYTRSSPDRNPYNNNGFPGNYNPNTGKTSTGNPDTYLDNYYNKSSSKGNYNVDYSNTGLLKDVNPYMGTNNYTEPNSQYYSNTTINNNDVNYNYNNNSTPPQKKSQPSYNSNFDQIYNTDTYKYYNNKNNENIIDNNKILEERKRKEEEDIKKKVVEKKKEEENIMNEKINEFKKIYKKKVKG